ncbi:MAG TPA: DNA methyltransferase [Gaiellaceae bacterium]|nr:DNA methyltransferase [Gaiellaceae bacterium]
MAVTQDELYATLDLDLSWSEAELPERERTKHVHRLHPYHGKFIPQLVEVLLDRYLEPGDHVLDPFAGSGTTLVQALESGLDATGVDIASFNCLLMRVKTAPYDIGELGEELQDVAARIGSLPRRGGRVSGYLRDWYAARAAGELLAFRGLIPEYRHRDVLRVILSRAARSARLTAHFDLEAPKAPQRGEYWCHKHRRECRPVDSAAGFLRRYTLDTLARIERFAQLRNSEREATVLHGDAREFALAGRFDGILTSPPYPGLIDYHEQHRYAYELLQLDDRREREIGAAASGTTLAALEAYRAGIAAVLARAAAALRGDGPVLVVVNDRRDLYPEILARAGLQLEARLRRHVNRRTGRRAGEYFEDVLVARAA